MSNLLVIILNVLLVGAVSAVMGTIVVRLLRAFLIGTPSLDRDSEIRE